MGHTHHFTKEQLNERFEMPGRLRNLAFGLIGTGLVLLLAGIFLGGSSSAEKPAAPATEEHHSSVTHTPDAQPVSDTDEAHGEEAHETASVGKRVLANLLLCSVYFLSIGMGAMFFLTVHRIGNAGWHTAIMRVPEAITVGWLPVGVVGFAAMFFFLGNIYEWAHIPPGVDALIDTKRAYLNEPFFIGRTLLFFAIWIGAALLLRRLSLRQDEEGGLSHFKRSEGISAAFVILFAISYSFFAFDWLKSLEPHWFSTIFGVQFFGGSMVIANVTIYMILRYLQKQGYMQYVNEAHYHDLGKYTFGFSIFWAYTWLAQFLLIWYSNIPEEGIYYVKRYRTEDHEYLGYAFFFFGNILVNFLVPFLGLMTRDAKRKLATFLPVAVVLIYGHWHDLFLMIMPGTVGQNPGIGLIEIGMFAAFAGLFIFLVFRALGRANLAPVQHPYLEESLHHTTGPV
ncbi:MAG: hypothetical protein EAZ89_18385 [Bacteroidetes bacterium]|nr:MAG: hypothetical protein EAZ89_18385 [Bacteroidota bacterium]